MTTLLLRLFRTNTNWYKLTLSKRVYQIHWNYDELHSLPQLQVTNQPRQLKLLVGWSRFDCWQQFPWSLHHPDRLWYPLSLLLMETRDKAVGAYNLTSSRLRKSKQYGAWAQNNVEFNFRVLHQLFDAEEEVSTFKSCEFFSKVWINLPRRTTANHYILHSKMTCPWYCS